MSYGGWTFLSLMSLWWLILRIVPKGYIPCIVYRVWFAVTLLLTMLGTGISCWVIRRSAVV